MEVKTVPTFFKDAVRHIWVSKLYYYTLLMLLIDAIPVLLVYLTVSIFVGKEGIYNYLAWLSIISFQFVLTFIFVILSAALFIKLKKTVRGTEKVSESVKEQLLKPNTIIYALGLASFLIIMQIIFSYGKLSITVPFTPQALGKFPIIISYGFSGLIGQLSINILSPLTTLFILLVPEVVEQSNMIKALTNVILKRKFLLMVLLIAPIQLIADQIMYWINALSLTPGLLAVFILYFGNGLFAMISLTYAEALWFYYYISEENKTSYIGSLVISLFQKLRPS